MNQRKVERISVQFMRKKVSKKTVILCQVVLLLLSTIAGCQVTYSDYTIEQNDTDEEMKISYSWWGTDARHSYTMQIVEAFNSINNNVNVSCRYGDWNGYEKKIQVYMLSNNETDVMQINFNWLYEYSKDGLGYYDLYQLEEYIDLSKYDTIDLKTGEVNGKLNAIPCSYNTTMVFYNKSLYKSLGLEVPSTWNGFFENAEIFRDAGIYQIALPSNKMLFLMLISYFEQTTGKPAFSESGEMLLTEEDLCMMVEFYKKMIEERIMCPMEQFEISQFNGERVAAVVSWATDADKYGNYLMEKGREVLIKTFPVETDAKRSGKYIKPTLMYSISANTKNPEEAAKFLNYMINDENSILLQGTEKGIPVAREAVEILAENKKLDKLEYVAYEIMMDDRGNMNQMVPVIENVDIIKFVKQEMDKAIYNEITVEECAANLYTEIKGIIDGL